MKLLGRSVALPELTRLLQDASLDELMALVTARHAVHFDPVRVGEVGVECIQISDMQAYIDYFAGKLRDYQYPEHEIAMALAGLPPVAEGT